MTYVALTTVLVWMAFVVRATIKKQIRKFNDDLNDFENNQDE